MARSPAFPPIASTRRQKRTPPPTPNARPAPNQRTKRSKQPPEPPCIPRKRKNWPATPLPASPSAVFAHLEIHSAPDAAFPRNKKTPPPLKSAKPPPSVPPVRSTPESATDKEDRKPPLQASHIRARQSANTRAYRSAPKSPAAHSANHPPHAGSR